MTLEDLAAHFRNRPLSVAIIDFAHFISPASVSPSLVPAASNSAKLGILPNKMLGTLTTSCHRTAPRCSVSAACSTSAPNTRTRRAAQHCQRRRIGTCPVCNADVSRCEHSAEQPRRREMVIGLGGLLLATAVPLDARADGGMSLVFTQYANFRYS